MAVMDSVSTGLPKSDTKVLVKATLREVRVRTGHFFEKEVDAQTGKVKAVVKYYYRQFVNYHAWMTDVEAEKLVEASWNLVNGYPDTYSYPAGMPMPVAGDDLPPPLTDDSVAATDPRTLELAREFAAEQAAALQAFEDEITSRLAAEAKAKTKSIEA